MPEKVTDYLESVYTRESIIKWEGTPLKRYGMEIHKGVKS